MNTAETLAEVNATKADLDTLRATLTRIDSDISRLKTLAEQLGNQVPPELAAAISAMRASAAAGLTEAQAIDARTAEPDPTPT